MKPFFFTKKLRTITFILAGLLMVAQSLVANGSPFEEQPVKKGKNKTEKSKKFDQLNNGVIKIYPDILKRTMHVISKEGQEQMDFFVFDLQGTLKQHVKMNPKDHYKVAGLARGIYIYRVFSGDNETATGQFEIR